MADKTGDAVYDQAADDSLTNTEPAMLRGTVMALVGAVGTALVVFGVISEEDRERLVDSAGEITVALLVVIPIIQGIIQAIWTRASVYSPKTAAEIAVVNAVGRESSAPTLVV